MPEARTNGRQSRYGARPARVRRAASLGMFAILIAGCMGSDPPILGPGTTARVGGIDLETPPVKAATPPALPPTAVSGAQKSTQSRPPVALPEAKVASGPNRIDLALADVREAALHNNLDIDVEQVLPALARENTAEAEARFEPTGFARYLHTKVDIPLVPRVRFADGVETDTAEVGIRVPLQTGGFATINMPVTRTDSGFPGIGDLYESAAGFSLSQPLLRNAGLKVNRAPITVARLNERQQDARTKLAILNVLANADRTYWNLYAAARSVEVRLQQHQRALTQEHQANRLAEEGVVPAIEITRARAGVARRIQDIIRAENVRRLTERELKRVMNRPEVPVGSTTALIALSQPDPRELELDNQRALQTALANRMELLDLELQMAIDSLSVDVARNAKLPSLAVDYSFRYLGAASRYDNSLDQLSDTDFNNQAVGLVLEVPLGNNAREARFRRAILQRVLTETTTAQQRQLIERQVLDTIDRIQEAWQRILAAREETLLAATNYQAEQRQFLAGSRTSTDVLQAADFLADAQLREVDALTAYEIAKIDLAFVTGTLIGSGKVELQPYAPRASTASAALPDVPADEQRVAQKLTALGVTPPAPQAAAEVVSNTPPVGATPEPHAGVEPTPDPREASASIGPVTETDTLWAIASAHRPSSDVTVTEMMDALVRTNPAAFVEQDPARMRRGAMLRLPNPEAFKASTVDAAPADAPSLPAQDTGGKH